MCMHQNKLWGISKNSHVIMSYIQTPHKLHSTDYIIHLQFFFKQKDTKHRWTKDRIKSMVFNDCGDSDTKLENELGINISQRLTSLKLYSLD